MCERVDELLFLVTVVLTLLSIYMSSKPGQQKCVRAVLTQLFDIVKVVDIIMLKRSEFYRIVITSQQFLPSAIDCVCLQ